MSFLSFYQMKTLKNYKEFFLFLLKVLTLLRYSRFCISFFCFFPSVRHSSRRWLKLNLKFYGIINWLNNNLKTHFVCFFQKKGRSDITSWSVDRVLNMKNFSWKTICRKYPLKWAPDLYSILLYSPKQPIHGRNILKIRCFQRKLSKNLWKVNL